VQCWEFLPHRTHSRLLLMIRPFLLDLPNNFSLVKHVLKIYSYITGDRYNLGDTLRSREEGRIFRVQPYLFFSLPFFIFNIRPPCAASFLPQPPPSLSNSPLFHSKIIGWQLPLPLVSSVHHGSLSFLPPPITTTIKLTSNCS
jgi:hypothetical protein